MKRSEREALRKRSCKWFSTDGCTDARPDESIPLTPMEAAVFAEREIDRERRRAKAVEAELQEAEELETKRAKGER